jgi:hypothetical protein
MPRKAKIGSLVEVTWADAIFYNEVAGVEDECLRNGGAIIHTTGYVLTYNSKVLVLVSELDSNRDPLRDVNVIPLPIVKNIRVISRGRFGQ